jgi:uncharacterized protein (TIGR04562 family)
LESTRDQVARKWSFPWDAMGVLIGGKSSIDLADLRIADWDEATRFFINYGYDPEKPSDQKLLHEVFVEAVHFIEKHLMAFRGKKAPPEEVFSWDDPRKILLMASNQDKALKLQRAWACALLRIMHTIAHIDGIQRFISLKTASEQIEKRFLMHVHKDENGTLWLGEIKHGVELERFQVKNDKARESIILKLLHKPANVAENIYDLLGVRIVAKRRSDVMVAVKYLRQYYMITLPNTNPTRARNTLLDVDRFQTQVNELREKLVTDKMTPREFSDRIEELTLESNESSSAKTNPHSADSYRAIQLTCRQLIRSENPNFAWLKKIRAELESSEIDPKQKEAITAVIRYTEAWPNIRSREEIAAFFPFEVQVLDSAAYAANQLGDANHNRYKQSQVRAARRRILHEIFTLTK